MMHGYQMMQGCGTEVHGRQAEPIMRSPGQEIQGLPWPGMPGWDQQGHTGPHTAHDNGTVNQHLQFNESLSSDMVVFSIGC